MVIADAPSVDELLVGDADPIGQPVSQIEGAIVGLAEGLQVFQVMGFVIGDRLAVGPDQADEVGQGVFQGLRRFVENRRVPVIGHAEGDRDLALPVHDFLLDREVALDFLDAVVLIEQGGHGLGQAVDVGFEAPFVAARLGVVFLLDALGGDAQHGRRVGQHLFDVAVGERRSVGHQQGPQAALARHLDAVPEVRVKQGLVELMEGHQIDGGVEGDLIQDGPHVLEGHGCLGRLADGQRTERASHVAGVVELDPDEGIAEIAHGDRQVRRGCFPDRHSALHRPGA